MRKLFSATIITCILCIIAQAAYSQKLPDLIHDLCGAKWIGHYQNSEDSNLVHILQWEIEYDGKVARALKSVPELGFFMETNIFFDYEQDRFASISLLNKAMIRKGTITSDENHLKIRGKSYFQDGSSEFKVELMLSDKGQLEDRFYRKTKDGDWILGHLILYER